VTRIGTHGLCLQS